jgi:hypothetical protein
MQYTKYGWCLSNIVILLVIIDPFIETGKGPIECEHDIALALDVMVCSDHACLHIRHIQELTFIFDQILPSELSDSSSGWQLSHGELPVDLRTPVLNSLRLLDFSLVFNTLICILTSEPWPGFILLSQL